MTKRNGLKVAVATMLLASTAVLLPSSQSYAFLSIDEATMEQQLVQIGIAEQDLQAMLQAIESLELGPELVQALEQMMGVQTIVEDVVAYEVPAELVQEYDIISPFEHARLTEERTQYMNEIDAEISSLEAEIALNPSQFETLQAAMGAISEPRSDIVATQAQFVGDQSRLEQERRKMAVDILRNKRTDIMRQLEAAHNNSEKAALACIDAPVEVKC